MVERSEHSASKRGLAPIGVIREAGFIDISSGVGVIPMRSDEQIERGIVWITDPSVSATYYPSGKNPSYEKASSILFGDVYIRSDVATYEILAPDQKAIGHTTLHSMNKENRSAEFGIMIGDLAYRREGYARYATELTLHLARVHGFEYIRWDVREDNIPSLRLVEAYPKHRVQPRDPGFVAFMLDLSLWQPTLSLSPVAI